MPSTPEAQSRIESRVVQSRVTNTNPSIERRAFLRTAAGSTAGAVLGGATVLTACKTTTKTDSTVVNVSELPTTVLVTTTVPVDTAPATTDDSFNGIEATVWRLSTRNQRSPCSACKAHAAHRYFVSEVAAEADRAHAGCSCELREQRTNMGQINKWFGEGGEVFDDRWT